MHLTSRGGLCHPRRPFQPHEAVGEVLTCPPRGQPLYVEGVACLHSRPWRRRRHSRRRNGSCGPPCEAGGRLDGPSGIALTGCLHLRAMRAWRGPRPTLARRHEATGGGVVWCGVVWCGVVWCGVAWRGVAWRGVAWRGVAWRGVAWRGVAWRGVAWRGVVWCGVVWCGVVWLVWCGVPKALLPNGNGRDALHTCNAKREGCVSERMLCVVCCAPVTGQESSPCMAVLVQAAL